MDPAISRGANTLSEYESEDTHGDRERERIKNNWVYVKRIWPTIKEQSVCPRSRCQSSALRSNNLKQPVVGPLYTPGVRSQYTWACGAGLAFLHMHTHAHRHSFFIYLINLVASRDYLTGLVQEWHCAHQCPNE